MDFTNREIASAIVFAFFIVLAFLLNKGKRTISKSLIKVFKAIYCKQILTVLFLYSTYSILIFYLAYKIGVWDFDLSKDSCIEFLLIGIPAIFVAVEARSEKDLLKRVFLTEVGFAAFLSFYLSLESFNLLIEVILQITIVFLTMVQAVAKSKSKYRSAYKLSTFMLSTIGLFMAASLTYQLFSNLNAHDWLFELRAFLLTIWFPALALPFLFALAYFSSFELMYRRLRVIASDVPFSYRLVLIAAFSFRMKYARHFAGMWAFKLKDCRSVKEVRVLLKDYKRDLRQRITSEKEKAALFKEGEGKKGYLQDGLWADRSMLKKIKRKLELIGNHQNTYWRDNSIYRYDLEGLVEACTPDNCSSGFYVQPDGKLWACWMSNPTGFALGLGSLEGQYPPLRYEKPFEPTQNDLANLSCFTADGTSCPNWMYDDSIDESLIE